MTGWEWAAVAAMWLISTLLICGAFGTINRTIDDRAKDLLVEMKVLLVQAEKIVMALEGIKRNSDEKIDWRRRGQG